MNLELLVGQGLAQLLCRYGMHAAPKLDMDVWAAILVANAIALMLFVRHVLRIAKPVKRSGLHGGFVVFSLASLFMVTALFYFLDKGYVLFGFRNTKFFYCSTPGLYWALMAIMDWALVGSAAVSISCVIRLRRPYRKYTDLVG